MLRLFPLLVVPLIIYNLIVFFGAVVFHMNIQDALSITHSIGIKMFSGETWQFSFGDFIILLTIGLLFIEVIKATRTTSREIINHGLSLLTFIVALIEFITLKGFASTPFFFVVVMTLFDVAAGYTISIVAAEHDLGLGRSGTD
ncbi:MAG: hypothetical protein JSR60_00380 [Proteobacteria bacterium]|nr:hypothetical protein [Pseudomonadota bacterium]